MASNFKLSRRTARFRTTLAATLVLALAACDGADSLNPDNSTNPEIADQGPANDPLSGIDEDTPLVEDDSAQQADAPLPSFSTAFGGGIPIGTSAQPNSYFGSRYNGAWRYIWPEYLRSNLAAIKSRGGKVILMMAGPQNFYKDASGHFSMSKWKARIDRYRKIDISSYIKDGTIIAHVLMDEPNDPTNWNGQRVSPGTVESMAQYSKSIWPAMSTVVRAYPDYMAQYSGSYRYLDAAWAQYVYRKGNVQDFISSNVRLAQSKGLALVVGLNLLRGGPNKTKMTSTQVKSWGSTLLSSSYPCAFISWQYNDTYLSSSGIKDAMSYLRNKAENRSMRTCRGS